MSDGDGDGDGEEVSASASVEASTGDESEHLVQTGSGSVSRGKAFATDGERPSTFKALFGGRRTQRQTAKIDHDQRTLGSAQGYQTVDDIEVTVCDPQKVDNYVLYVVKTKV